MICYDKEKYVDPDHGEEYYLYKERKSDKVWWVNNMARNNDQELIGLIVNAFMDAVFLPQVIFNIVEIHSKENTNSKYF